MRMSSKKRNSKGRKILYDRHPEVLYWAKQKMPFVVCNSDSFLDIFHVKGKCYGCGREVTVNISVQDVEVKLCLLCNPQLPEQMREEMREQFDGK